MTTETNTQFEETGIPSWKCDKGDVVSFGLRRGAEKVLLGTVQSRPTKNLASILSIDGNEMMIHVGQIAILSQAKENTIEHKIAAARERKQEKRRQDWLERMKRLSAPQNQRKFEKAKKKPAKVRKVFGMTFEG